MEAKCKQRTAEEIIGNDRLIQLQFEGYSVVPTKDLWFKPMCGESIKGDVTFDYEWSNGPYGGGFTMPSDAAERKIIESAQAVIYHAMLDGAAKLTLSAKRRMPR